MKIAFRLTIEGKTSLQIFINTPRTIKGVGLNIEGIYYICDEK